jgi:GTP-binding protein
MFHDEAEVFVEAGKGGDGCMSFRRERYVPKGGPDGGDGGAGGSVVFIADDAVGSLRHLRQEVHIRAEKGRPGEGQNRIGRAGGDRTIKVPCGTLIRDRDTGLTLRDLVRAGDRVVVARGGKPGRGNKHFATSTNRAPRHFTHGQEGEKRWLVLELKLIADVGLVGFPNAGKSTFLSRVSAARPKVADYPFTTLEPHLGLVELDDHRTLVIADVPGLIEGAHSGRGLGRRFLRHLERTRLLLFLLDPTDDTHAGPAEAYAALEDEIARFSPAMAAKPRVVAATKADLWGEEPHAERLSSALGTEVQPLSSVSGQGLRRLVQRLASLALNAPDAGPEGGRTGGS